MLYYTRNSDLTYYESHSYDVNCGSYALRLNEWYDPESYFEDVIGSYVENWIGDMADEGHSEEEISNIYGSILLEGMLLEFDGELEICDGTLPTDDDVELIAFSTYCWCDEDRDDCFRCIGYDFHFRVLRDGVWMEKCGCGPVRECNIDDWGDYIGDVIYMYHRIGDYYDE